MRSTFLIRRSDFFLIGPFQSVLHCRGGESSGPWLYSLNSSFQREQDAQSNRAISQASHLLFVRFTVPAAQLVYFFRGEFQHRFPPGIENDAHAGHHAGKRPAEVHLQAESVVRSDRLLYRLRALRPSKQSQLPLAAGGCDNERCGRGVGWPGFPLKSMETSLCSCGSS